MTETTPDVQVEGFCADRFEKVRDAFVANFTNGDDVGASVAASIDGELVLDLWGGRAGTRPSLDAATEPWQRDSIINVWSSTKTMLALSALMLADRGEIDLHAPVARYWPEFAANGKEAIEVRHLLSHTSGLSGWDMPLLATEDVYDWDLMCSRLAAQAPWWEPGTASGYHALSEGYLVGEVIRRVTGVTMGTFFRTEVAEPLGADFHVGTPAECDDRVISVIPPTAPFGADGADPDSVAAKTAANPQLDAAVSATVSWRRAEIPAANGHGNARSIVQTQGIISNGGTLGGRQFLSAAGVEALFEVQSSGTDLVLGTPMRFGMGYGLNGAEMPISPNPRTCFWGGWGGSIVINDLDARMTFSYVMNKMGEGTTGDLRGAMLLMELYGALAGG
jgi:CubicO group peptidase (beta-lactamase class C family)